MPADLRLNPFVDRLMPFQTTATWHPPTAPSHTVTAIVDSPDVVARDLARLLRSMARQLDRLDRDGLA